ncbi:LacI family DNA-binding transcriptional regulator [Candidatus Enterococcus ferrettii]|uniref:LacI family transcriptional regulator n=1 Tax=Candidatus Enterococcus ferrettii TaxID=2815324 RepID=A0ABV0EU42_9ENTE|nr:LacI family DNA-binding transcriptional regulator [Enterococcus sp. 665A]MBO1339533.1 LacI family DNA-binding transcriptional regulator [Enterococcus sp. 665A]
MVGIRDVARRAQVSPGTVSRVLNSDETLSVTDSTKERIYQAAQELNYDIKKRKYNRAKTTTIGLVSTITRQREIDDPYFSELRLSMEEECKKRHFNLEQYALADVFKKSKLISNLDALVVLGTIEKGSIEKLLDHNCNIILLDNPDIDLSVDLVFTDFSKVTKKVLSLFVAAGHKEIAYIGGYNIDIDEQGNEVADENEKRLKAYKEFMNEQGLSDKISYKLGEWEPLEGKRMADELLAERADNFPTALLVGSDPLSVGVYRAIQSAGKTIGRDVVVSSYDDIEIAEFLTPNLTTVKVNAKELGKAAVRLANEKIQKEREVNVTLSFPAKLIIRESFVPKEK